MNAKAAPTALLVSDVDGTLVTNDKQLTPATIEAVRRLEAAGIGFTITSSRPPIGLLHVIKALDLQLPVAGFNGGAIVRPDLSPILTLPLDPESARHALDLILDYELDAWVFNQDHWLVRNPDAPHVAREAFTVQTPPERVDSFDGALDHVGKIVAVGDDPGRLAGCKAAIGQSLSATVSATRSQSFFLDVTHIDANKGEMIDRISELLAVPAERIAVIGDGWNDMLMFRRAGLSIAMGNAAPEVQAAARLVTGTNEADGFASAVERFLLSSSSREM
jgi:Cof subfamily protein (haloacid dehalogenase superfamily)